MVAVTVEEVLGGAPKAQLTITGLGIGDSLVSVWRTADGVRSPVRGARRAPMVDAALVTDYDVPLGRPVTYEVEVISGPSGASRTSTEPLVVDSETAWLMNPMDPSTAVPVLGRKDSDGAPYLRAEALAKLEYEADVSLFTVMGSDAPMALFGQVMQARGVPLSMGTRSAEQNTKLRALMQSTAQLLFRPVPSFGVDLPGVMFVSISKKTELPTTVSFGGNLTWWEMTADTVAAPVLKVLTATFTYGDVAILFSTYQQKQDALASGATYLDDAKNPFG